MANIILMEDLTANEANLVESIAVDKSYYLNGILMQSEIKNGNGRVYKSQELHKVVEECTKKISEGNLIMGELEHPDTLKVNLDRVSHVITEMRMDGNNVVGKMKLLNTPSGNVARAILEGGVRLGVSSRGSGSVDGNGIVNGFSFVTVDIVSEPSARDARPSLVYESLHNQKIMTLAEAVVHDNDAQKYLRAEIKKFIKSIIK